METMAIRSVEEDLFSNVALFTTDRDIYCAKRKAPSTPTTDLAPAKKRICRERPTAIVEQFVLSRKMLLKLSAEQYESTIDHICENNGYRRFFDRNERTEGARSSLPSDVVQAIRRQYRMIRNRISARESRIAKKKANAAKDVQIERLQREVEYWREMYEKVAFSDPC